MSDKQHGSLQGDMEEKDKVQANSMDKHQQNLAQLPAIYETAKTDESSSLQHRLDKMQKHLIGEIGEKITK